jgi:ankyrin repeat protein
MGFQTDLEKWASSIREEMRLREAQENSGFREESRSMFKFVTEEQKLAKHHRILAAKAATKNKVLDFFSTYNYETAHKQIRKAGNTSLHKRHVQYQEWKDSLDSCTLLFTGKLGSGKSVLLANIVGDLSLSTAKEPPLVAYFFCRHDVQESLQARTILGSLARQLLRTLSDLEMLSERCGSSHIADSADTILESFLEGYSPSQRTCFVIDGLDECDETERRILVDAFQKIQRKLKALFCISLRIEPNKSLSFLTEQLLATRIIPLPEENPDIDAFIEADLRRCLEQELLTIGDATLIIDIQDALVAGSQGMFLWVALQIQSLCSMKTDHAIRNALADLPKDISHTFARILDKSGSSDPLLQAKTLQVVLAAERPLTTEELREALSVIPGDADWDPSKMLNNVYSALACCGCLLTVDEEESTVRVVHHSAKQYILYGLDKSKHTSFSIDDAQRALADIVVTYLAYGVFETQLSRVNNRPIIPQSAPSSILQSAMGSSITARNLAMKILAGRKRPTFDLSKTIAEVCSSSSCQPEDSFKFYAYVKEYWQKHVFYVSGHHDSIYKFAARAIHGRASNFDDVPLSAWGWAAEHGNAKLVELWCKSDKHNLSISTPLIWAIELGRRDIVNALLSAGVDVNERDSSGTPLIVATMRGNKEIVELLLGTGKVDINSESYDGALAIIIAARDGHREIAELLLDLGKADPNLQNPSGETALITAAVSGYSDIAQLLLASGSDPNLKDVMGWTALMKAAEKGNKTVVKLLVNNSNVNLNAKTRSGRTALMIAVNSGQKEVVKLFVENKDVDLNAKDSQGTTARMLAKLRSKEAAIMANTSSGYEADWRLQQAVMYKGIVELLDRGPFALRSL